MSKKSFKNIIAKLLLCLLIPAAIFLLIILLGSLLIINTNIPENSSAIFMIIASAACCILMTILLVLNFRTKGIYCAVITFAVIFMAKIIFTLIMEGKINITVHGIVNIVFLAIFAFVGAIIGTGFKK